MQKGWVSYSDIKMSTSGYNTLGINQETLRGCSYQGIISRVEESGEWKHVSRSELDKSGKIWFESVLISESD